MRTTKRLWSFRSAWCFWDDNPKAVGTLYAVDIFRRKVLKKKVAYVLWNPIFNAPVKSIAKLHPDTGVARYMSANRLIRSYLKKGESRLKFAKWRESFDVRATLLGASLGLEEFVERTFIYWYLVDAFSYQPELRQPDRSQWHWTQGRKERRSSGPLLI